MKKSFILLLITLLISMFSDCYADAFMIDNVCSNPFSDKTRVVIKFETNGGPKINDLNYCSSCGTGSFNLPIPVRAGYTFEGWYTDIGLTKKVNNKFIKSIDGKALTIIPDGTGCNVRTGYTHLYAKWEKNVDIDITLTLNTGINDKVEYINICSTCLESDITLPALQKDGYVLVGWYAEPELINKVNIQNNKSKDIYEKLTLETNVNKDYPDRRYGVIYAGWIEKNELKYLIVDEVDKTISIINDFMNR